MEKQHKKEKLHAMERIQALLDEGSFREWGSGIRNESEGFGLKKESVLYDGVITGYGRVNGRKVVIYVQDFSVMAGTLGKKHGEKIAHAIRMAIENRCPIIGINDSGGARIQEGVDALSGYGEIFYQNIRASGYIPQISIIAGNCAGGAAYSPGITDFVFMIQEIGSMYITGPRVIQEVFHQEVSREELGSSKMHGEKSGVIHVSARTEQDCYTRVKELLAYIPHFYGDYELTENCFPGDSAGLRDILPKRKAEVYDIKKVITEITDKRTFFEIQKDFAPNIVVGFGKFQGGTIGIVANQPFCKGGVLDVNGSMKAARFIRYCDSFEIPILTLVDVPGFMPGLEQEEKGLIRHGAKLLYAYGESTVPKVTVILRKAYGGAYIAMGSKHLGADFVYAWPDAEIAVMGAEPAIEILYRKELSSLEGEERESRLHDLVEKYKGEVMNTNKAQLQGYIDEVLLPEETRSRLCEDFRFLKNKGNIDSIKKKHGNIPL